MPGDAIKAENQGRKRRTLTAFLKEEAAAKGFDLCRITRPDAIPEAPDRLRQFLAAGCHGTMEWLAETAERRADPRVLWSDVRSIVLFGMNYGPDSDPLAILARRDRGRDLGLRSEPRLSRRRQGAAEGDRHALCGARRRGCESLRRHRPGHGKAAR
ncbi:hypothetical protein ABIA27_006524 [Sinorhizobium fredii]